MAVGTVLFDKMLSRLKSSYILTFCVIFSCLPLITVAVPSFKLGEPEAQAWSSNNRREEDDDDDAFQFIKNLITITIAIVVIVVAVCLILCFCCPICVIAKMRQRRGVVITGPPAASTNGQTVTVSINRSAAPVTTYNSPPVVAISSSDRSKPYPVQESVTVVPLLQPQQQHYPTQSQPANYPPAPQFPQSFELPPPYPGLPRDTDTSNLPFNPYYSDEANQPTAPPPK